MLTILVKALELQRINNDSLIDTRNHWAHVAISTAYSHGIIQGFEDGTFRPKNNATRAEAVTIIIRALGED